MPGFFTVRAWKRNCILYLLDQVYIRIIDTLCLAFLMGCHININTVCLNGASTVLCHIYLSVYHYLTAIRDLGRVYCYCVVGSCGYTCRRDSIGPRTATDAAWTVMCDAESSSGFRFASEDAATGVPTCTPLTSLTLPPASTASAKTPSPCFLKEFLHPAFYQFRHLPSVSFPEDPERW